MCERIVFDRLLCCERIVFFLLPKELKECFVIIELRHEKTGFLPMRKQRRRSAVQ